MRDCYLIQYREAIRRGEIIAGRELIMELDRLIDDLDDERYIYDTTGAYERMDFMENCIRLTKAPFYNQPMKLMLWQKAFIEVVYSFKIADCQEEHEIRNVLCDGTHRADHGRAGQ